MNRNLFEWSQNIFYHDGVTKLVYSKWNCLGRHAAAALCPSALSAVSKWAAGSSPELPPHCCQPRILYRRQWKQNSVTQEPHGTHAGFSTRCPNQNHNYWIALHSHGAMFHLRHGGKSWELGVGQCDLKSSCSASFSRWEVLFIF